jgi:hypothetical protein
MLQENWVRKQKYLDVLPNTLSEQRFPEYTCEKLSP